MHARAGHLAEVKAGRLPLVVVQDDLALRVVIQQSSHEPQALSRSRMCRYAVANTSFSVSSRVCQGSALYLRPGPARHDVL